MNFPNHIGIILDGNGRWAKKRLKPRYFGHSEGAKTAKKIVLEARQLGIKNLTLFALSAENTQRPPAEVTKLLSLMYTQIAEQKNQLLDHDIKLNFVGQFKKILSPEQQNIIKQIEEDTHRCQGMTVNVCLNYGGRQDLTEAARSLAEEVSTGKIKPSDIDEKLLGENLPSGTISDMDLIIRTGGYCRLSNFLLWQTIYSDLYFTPILWPDFSKKDLLDAINYYNSTQRNFGLIPQDQKSFNPQIGS